jgi:hypothetical protein
MPARIYFDTNVFRAVSAAFEKNSLPDELKERVLISPLTAFEVLSQLTVKNAGEVLRQIQAVPNWTDPKRTGLLPWPDDMLSQLWFQKPTKDDRFTERMQKAFNVCLAASSVEPLQEEAGKLKDVMDEMRRKRAQDFQRLLEAARKEALEGERFSEAWFQGIANRTHADAKSNSVSKLAKTLSAYHEFEEVKLQTALQNPEYNAESHVNDLFDAEQLVYLGDVSLCFLTGDKGFRRVKKSDQAARIVVVTFAELSDAKKVEAVLRNSL